MMQGLGVAANSSEGESWLRRAALAGDAEAAILVGNLYARGGKLPPNYAEAATWFRRAAEAGHKGAARALGLLYLTGTGVAPDTEEAAQWFRISAAAGDAAARAELGNLVLSKALEERTTGSTPANGSSKRQRRAIWSQRSTTASAWLGAWACHATTSRRRSGSARLPTGW